MSQQKLLLGKDESNVSGIAEAKKDDVEGSEIELKSNHSRSLTKDPLNIDQPTNNVNGLESTSKIDLNKVEVGHVATTSQNVPKYTLYELLQTDKQSKQLFKGSKLDNPVSMREMFISQPDEKPGPKLNKPTNNAQKQNRGMRFSSQLKD